MSGNEKATDSDILSSGKQMVTPHNLTVATDISSNPRRNNYENP